MSTLELPSRKLYIIDIEKYYRQMKTSSTQLSIWIQGIVIENSPSSSELLIDDGTGTVQVLGNDKIPNCPRVHKGQYVMVIGFIVECNQICGVRAIKVQDLTACVAMETMWMLEVIDQSLMCS